MLGGGKDDLTQKGQYISISTPLGLDKVVLLEYQAEEAVSEPFLYRLKLMSKEQTLSFDKVIGKAATITVEMTDDTGSKLPVSGPAAKRYVNGIITRFELTHYDELKKYAYYEAEMRPWLWMLTLSGDCRIFQNKSVVDIVTAVCKGAGYTAIKKSLTSTYAKREYCVQYMESDFNFICRLLQEEGIFYYFEHTKTKHMLVLGDSSSAFKNCPKVHQMTYRPTIAYDNEDDTVTSLRYQKAVTLKTVSLGSYNFEQPTSKLVTKSRGAKGTGTKFLYTGNYTKSNVGQKYARIIQEAGAATGELVRGSGRVRTLIAGGKIKIKDHPRSDMNGDFVLQRVRVKAERTSYEATFEAFPSRVRFRPPGECCKPRIHSSQTALVVGKKGEEIWVDKYGRIKVQFYWDRLGKKDDKSSCWIRVSQGWAGKSFGMMFLPRIGQEVIVSFIDGDPDRPIVTGAVYNGQQKIPYKLPTNSTKSTIKSQSSKKGAGKFNEIRFEDKKDKEEVYIQAQKDMKGLVKNDSTWTIKRDKKLTIQRHYTRTIKKNMTTKVQEGNEVHRVLKGTRQVGVKGKETHKNDDAFNHKVAKNYTLKVDGNLSIDVKGTITMKGKAVTVQAKQQGVTIKAAQAGKFQAGTALDLKAGTALTAKAGTAATVKSGTGLTVDAGTSLTAKSKMAMKLDAGMTMDVKAKLALTAEGLSTTVKGKGVAEVSASGPLTLKGAIVKIN